MSNSFVNIIKASNISNNSVWIADYTDTNKIKTLNFKIVFLISYLVLHEKQFLSTKTGKSFYSQNKSKIPMSE